MHYVLASQSPRRKEILSMCRIDFEVITSDADESCNLNNPAAFVEELAKRKGEAVLARLKESKRDLTDTAVIACDTVVYAEGEILGKPKDFADAARMLRMYSGKTHRVYSGIYLFGAGKSKTAHEWTDVEFDTLTEEQILSYVEREKPYDKAGAYAIQGPCAAYIPAIHGDYFNVVGLPLSRLNRLHFELFGQYLL